LRHELGHAFVAPQKRLGVVVVTDPRIRQHPLQVADGRGGAQIGRAARYERLVHVQCDRERALDVPESDRIRRDEHGSRSTVMQCRRNTLLGAADVG
jgi:hypothetical protein